MPVVTLFLSLEPQPLHLFLLTVNTLIEKLHGFRGIMMKNGKRIIISVMQIKILLLKKRDICRINKENGWVSPSDKKYLIDYSYADC